MSTVLKSDYETQYFPFLYEREGADDSDIEALMECFDLEFPEAAEIYRAWLDSL